MHKDYTKDKLDRFYTNKDLVDRILKELDFTKYDLIVEPSAGSGAFSLQIPKCLAFDIDPQHPSIIEQDFLKYRYTGEINRTKILCIGNPPYGRQSSLAIKFIKKCSEFADTIAFILPLSFKKPSVQFKLPLTYHLTKELDIPSYSFELMGKPYDVPCVFQIWENRNIKRVKLPTHPPIGFKYVKNSDDAHCALRRVGVYAGRAYLELDKNPQSHYFIQFEDHANLNQTIDKINSIKWLHGNTVGPRSISKSELNPVLNTLLQQLSSQTKL